ncbi:uncharacterized protein METZ01_LOCUS364036, partial [marine metagenome]
MNHNLNKVKDDAIITKKLQPTRPFVDGESSGLNRASILLPLSV